MTSHLFDSLDLSVLIIKSKFITVSARKGYKHLIPCWVDCVRPTLLTWPGPSSLGLTFPIWAIRVKTQEHASCLEADRKSGWHCH